MRRRNDTLRRRRKLTLDMAETPATEGRSIVDYDPMRDAYDDERSVNRSADAGSCRGQRLSL